MAINKEHIAAGFANSNGYFKDPLTGDWLTGLEPRSVAISITDTGSLVWPEVKISDGSSVKIVYKLWTDEEKQIYKQYRSTPKKHKPTVSKTVKKGDDYPVKPVGATLMDYDAGEVYHCEYDYEAAASANAKQLIDSCEELLDVVQIAGLTYARMLKIGDRKKIYCVPRALITDEQMRRLKQCT